MHVGCKQMLKINYYSYLKGVRYILHQIQSVIALLTYLNLGVILATHIQYIGAVLNFSATPRHLTMLTL